jgi:hypothetical protein
MFRAHLFSEDLYGAFHDPRHLDPPPSPACAQCSSSQTEPVATMARHTADAGEWFHCAECGRFFTTSSHE